MENLKAKGIRSKKGIQNFNERRRAGSGEASEAKKRAPKRAKSSTNSEVIPF